MLKIVLDDTVFAEYNYISNPSCLERVNYYKYIKYWINHYYYINFFIYFGN